MQPISPPRPPRRIRRSWIVSFALVLALGLLVTEFVWLRARQEARRTAAANEQVADRIAAARARMAARHWDEAIRHLEAALAVERASNRDEARPVLEEALRGQANSLLEGANLAIARKDSANALPLLHAYLTHPQATRLDRARLLRDDLERAVSDDEAARLLSCLSEDALSLFEKSGQLAEEDGLRATAVRPIFKDTLRRNLPKETRKRGAKRELERLADHHRAVDREQRIARLRATAAFRELLAFCTRTRAEARESEQRERRQDAELAQLFEQLNVANRAEQTEIRAGLLDREERESALSAVKNQRVQCKRTYRASSEFSANEGKLFDRLVDEELDKLLKMLPPSTAASAKGR